MHLQFFLSLPREGSEFESSKQPIDRCEADESANEMEAGLILGVVEAEGAQAAAYMACLFEESDSVSSLG